MRRLARWHPFLWLLGLTAAVALVGITADPQYDDGGFGLLWLLFALLVTGPYQLITAPVLALLGSTTAAQFVAPATYAVVLVGADQLLSRWARRRRPSTRLDAEPSDAGDAGPASAQL